MRDHRLRQSGSVDSRESFSRTINHSHIPQQGDHMKGQEQYISNALRGARDFLKENADRLGPINDSDAWKMLNETVDQLAAFATDQSTWSLEIDGAQNLQEVLEVELRKEH